jgi:methylated-DNA-[protein]-cysteine S-methyltransferase
MDSLSLHSPVGPLTVTARDGAVVALGWGRSPHSPGAGGETGLLALARTQLAEYFDGRRGAFALPLAPGGTDFQRRVWTRMSAIPFGATLSYGALADAVGSGPRAVAGACAANPIPILIPCHRVVGAGGALGGYSGGEGVPTKRLLLQHEGALPRVEPVFL